MADLRLPDKADLGLMHDIERQRHDSAMIRVVTRELAVAHYTGCPSVSYEIDRVAAGGAVFDGHKLHLAVLPQFH
jgi:hypothetical protein